MADKAEEAQTGMVTKAIHQASLEFTFMLYPGLWLYS